MHDENIKPWDRQQGEGRRAYEAFCIFRDLGEERNKAQVAEKLQKSYTLVHRWARQFDWQRRADAWDASITEAARKQAAAEYKEMIMRQKTIGHMLQVNSANSIQKRGLDKASFHSLAEFIRLGVDMERSAWEMTRAQEGAKDSGITFTFSRTEGAND